MIEPFREWIDDVVADEVVVNAADINAEAHANMWSFDVSAESIGAAQVSDLLAFVTAIIEARRAQLAALGAEPQSMVFYSWFDELAGQLRVSLVSGCHGRLPFAGRVGVIGELDALLHCLLESPYRSAIPLSGFSTDWDTEQDNSQREVAVWVTRVP
jgi:hypothetical protein